MRHVLVLVLWAIIVILSVILIVRSGTREQTLDIPSDQRITLQQDSIFTTDIPVTIEAASPEPFLIENEGQTDRIEGVSSKVPLCLEEDSYYYATPKPIEAGVWTVSESQRKIEVQIFSELPTTIHIQLQQDPDPFFPIIMAFLIWGMGACVYGMFTFNYP